MRSVVEMLMGERIGDVKKRSEGRVRITFLIAVLIMDRKLVVS